MTKTPDPQSDAQPEGISLSELTEAFAQAMGAGPPEQSPQPVQQEVADQDKSADVLEEPGQEAPAAKSSYIYRVEGTPYFVGAGIYK